MKQKVRLEKDPAAAVVAAAAVGGGTGGLACGGCCGPWQSLALPQRSLWLVLALQQQHWHLAWKTWRPVTSRCGGVCVWGGAEVKASLCLLRFNGECSSWQHTASRQGTADQSQHHSCI